MKKETAILWFMEDSYPIFHEREGDFYGTNEIGVPVRGTWYSNSPGNVTQLCGVEEYDYDKKWVSVPNGPSSWDSFDVPNKVQRDRMSLEEIKEEISSRDYSFISMRISDEGDRMVTMIGQNHEAGQWTENYGPSQK